MLRQNKPTNWCTKSRVGPADGWVVAFQFCVIFSLFDVYCSRAVEARDAPRLPNRLYDPGPSGCVTTTALQLGLFGLGIFWFDDATSESRRRIAVAA